MAEEVPDQQTQLATAILATLRGTVTYAIDYNHLTLMTPTGTALYLSASPQD
jgi:hypothetical protein